MLDASFYSDPEIDCKFAGASSANALVLKPHLISRESALIPLPGISRVDGISVGRHPQSTARGTLVGVLARLCGHLREMTGLTIRATVSQLDCSARSSVFTLSRLFTYCPASAVQPRLLRQRTATPIWCPSPYPSQALHQRNGNHNRFTTARHR